MKTIIKITFLIIYLQISSYSQWEQVSNNLYGTFVSCIEITDSNIYCGSYNGGIFMSKDKGLSWVNISTDMYSSEILDLTIFKNNIYTATEGEFQYSSNNGKTWNKAYPEHIYDISTVASNENYLFAGDRGTGFGLWRSTDNGITWEQHNNGLESNQIEFIKMDNDIVYLSTFSGLYKSTNYGYNWENIFYDSNYSLIYKIVTSDEKIFALAFGNKQGTGRKLYSIDKKSYKFHELGPQTFSNLISDIAYDDGKLIVATDSGLFLSSDNGKVWIQKNNLKDLFRVSYKDNLLFFTNWSDELYRSTNGGDSYEYSINGLSGLYIYYLYNINSDIYASNRFNNYKSANPFEYWVINNFNSIKEPISTVFQENNLVIAGTKRQGIFLSSDSGISWTNCDTGFEKLYINKFLKYGNKIFAATGDWPEKTGLLVSTDMGYSWSRSDIGIPDEVIHDIKRLNNIIFVGTHTKGIFKSSDEGISWSPANYGIDDYHIRIELLFTYKDKIFAYNNSEGLYESTNYGKTWRMNNEKFFMVTDAACDDSVIFISTYEGIFKSTDSGVSWSKITSENELLHESNSLLINGDYLYTGTSGNSVWRYKFK